MRNLVLILAVLGLSAAVRAEAQVAVVAHKSVPEAQVAAAALTKIYTLETLKWSNGTTVVVVDQKADSPVKAAFYGFIKKDPIALKREWMRVQLTGGDAPVMVGSDADVLQQVASTPGAIGYVSAASVTDAVKVVATIP